MRNWKSALPVDHMARFWSEFGPTLILVAVTILAILFVSLCPMEYQR